jgi:hypothetical protein
MKKYLSAVCFTALTLGSMAQVKGLKVEEIDNGGSVAGRTYRIYVELEKDSDQVLMVYGDATHLMDIRSTKPFYQSELGGDMSTKINRKIAKDNPSARYDSFVTIGLLDNYDNALTPFMNFDEFEHNGGALKTNDGAWYCTPDHRQTYPGPAKRVLLMQLTTEGQITGKFSVMGRDKFQNPFYGYDLEFTAGKPSK